MAPNCPIQFANAAASAGTGVPSLGADTDELLRDVGYDNDQLAALRKNGVLVG
jgi:crotonobetainyl-CoA:carnitine CoA-transferase CaiB-like acyl-CoA transferase